LVKVVGQLARFGWIQALLSAWDEAYSELASALISAKKELYAQAGVFPGELRKMQVVGIRRESEDVRAFLLEPVDGEAPALFKPGQYVSVSVKFEDGTTQLRQYSLSAAPNPRTLQISVKREQGDSAHPSGRVSNWIHNNVQLGSVILVTHPFGDFTPDTASAAPIVLLSAGIGITPMVSVLNHIAQRHPSRRVVFAHAAREEAYHAHRQDVAQAKKTMHNLEVVTFYENVNAHECQGVHPGRMDISKLPKWPYEEAQVYLCGPVEFMQTQWRALIEAGVPPARLHREVFGPELLNYLN